MRTFGGIIKSTRSWTLDDNFEKSADLVTSRISSSGGTHKSRINKSGQRVTKTAPIIDCNPISRTNTLLNSTDMTASSWLQDAGGWWTSRRSIDILPAIPGASVTKFTATTSSAPDNVFTRCNSISTPAGARSASIYIYFPSGQGIADYRIRADWGDVDVGPFASSTVFNQWVRLESAMTTTGVRTFLDFNIQVNGGLQVPNGTVFYCCCPQESATLGEWIPTGAAPVTVFDSLGLANEPSRTQLITYANDLTQTAWVKINTTTPAVDTIRETADNSFHTLYHIGSSGVGDIINFYAEVKADGRNIFILQLQNASDAVQASFDLNNPVLGGYVTSFGTASSAQRKITALEDGWYACEVSGSYSSTTSVFGAYIYTLDSLGAASYAGDITKGLKVRNMTCSVGRFATRPILSTGSTLASIASRYFISGTNFSSTYNPNEGTYLVEFTPYGLVANDVYWGIGEANNFNNSVYLANAGGFLFLVVYNAGVQVAAFNLTTLVAGTRYKVAWSYKAGEIAVVCNNGAEQVSSVSMPSIVNNEALLCSPWDGGGGYPYAVLHRRRYKPYADRSGLAALTV